MEARLESKLKKLLSMDEYQRQIVKARLHIEEEVSGGVNDLTTESENWK
jgi:hypothetical protein